MAVIGLGHVPRAYTEILSGRSALGGRGGKHRSASAPRLKPPLGRASPVDGQSIERFTAQAERYLQELQHNLETGSYRPNPVKRVEIPKGDGRTRPLGIHRIQVCGARFRAQWRTPLGSPGKWHQPPAARKKPVRC
jgi:hypothetical protein